MIFQHTLPKVKDGSKTQTRRICKPWDYPWYGFDDDDYEVPVGTPIKAVVNTAGVFERTRWVVGKTYSVQPTRAKAGVARIELLSIRREDVRDISDVDVMAEGFKTPSDFFITWVKMHDKDVQTPIIPDYYTGSIIWQGVRSILAERPAECYLAWALTFRLVSREGRETWAGVR